MNDQDWKDAFEAWLNEQAIHNTWKRILCEGAWQAAIEYEHKRRSPLDALSLYEKLEQERARTEKLVEALESISDYGEYSDHKETVKIYRLAMNAFKEYRDSK